MSYVDGFVVPVSRDKIEAYKAQARKAGEIWKEYGAVAPLPAPRRLAKPIDLPDGQFCEFAVQPFPQKYFASRFGRSSIIDSAVPSSQQGRPRDRHGR